jgi:cardiolipin synthase (CMP-forming)
VAGLLDVGRALLDRERVPNLISGTRIGAAPLAVVAGIADSSAGYFGWLALAAVTDTLDGVLARRWNVVSDRGRELDSWADLATLVSGLLGALLLWPSRADPERAFIFGFLAAHLVPALFGLIRQGRLLGYHSTLARVSTYASWPGAVLLMVGVTPVLFRLAVLLESIVALEYLIIWHLCPTHRGEIKSLCHALALRREAHTRHRPETAEGWPLVPIASRRFENPGTSQRRPRSGARGT